MPAACRRPHSLLALGVNSRSESGLLRYLGRVADQSRTTLCSLSLSMSWSAPNIIGRAKLRGVNVGASNTPRVSHPTNERIDRKLGVLGLHVLSAEPERRILQHTALSDKNNGWLGGSQKKGGPTLPQTWGFPRPGGSTHAMRDTQVHGGAPVPWARARPGTWYDPGESCGCGPSRGKGHSQRRGRGGKRRAMGGVVPKVVLLARSGERWCFWYDTTMKYGNCPPATGRGRSETNEELMSNYC